MITLLLTIIYLSFISLGLPDALLGAAWPTMYPSFHVPVSYAGGISLIISAGTVVSSLMADRLTRRFGTGKVTAVSVALTAAALFGFSISGSYWILCLWAIPYGLGAGSVDASLNNYVALHYASRHMSWLHCMWGVGASVGPYIMGLALTGNLGWQGGYRLIGILQLVLTLVLLASLPLWKKGTSSQQTDGTPALTIGQILKIPGAPEIMLAFFCYCAAESTIGLWASSYLVLVDGMDSERAASFASLFYIGITFGRGISGFLTYKFRDETMVRLGESIMLLGIVIILLPLGGSSTMIGLMLFGLGCAPVYPSIIHSTPAHFGAENSQAVIGIQMASAYLGTCAMPPLFGWLASHTTTGLLPWYLGCITLVLVVMWERLNRKTAR